MVYFKVGTQAIYFIQMKLLSISSIVHFLQSCQFWIKVKIKCRPALNMRKSSVLVTLLAIKKKHGAPIENNWKKYSSLEEKRFGGHMT